jgi:fumarate hydratase subunit beta
MRQHHYLRFHVKHSLSLSLPLSQEQIVSLKIGDKVLLSGSLYTMRDVAHTKLTDILQRGEQSPVPLSEGAIFYCGPAPTPPGKITGAIGPTTSARMDKFTPLLLEHGLKVMIGKGERSPEVEAAIREHEALYLVCVGGISALLTRSIVSRETFLWSELGAEAVYRLVAHELPCYVAYK